MDDISTFHEFIHYIDVPSDIFQDPLALLYGLTADIPEPSMPLLGPGLGQTLQTIKGY